MTYAEAKKILPRKWDWLPWRMMPARDFITCFVLGVALGMLAIEMQNHFYPPSCLPIFNLTK